MRNWITEALEEYDGLYKAECEIYGLARMSKCRWILHVIRCNLQQEWQMLWA